MQHIKTFFSFRKTANDTDVIIRPSTLSDVPHIISAFDGAVEWLVSKGLEGQWGTLPFSGVRGEALVTGLQKEVSGDDDGGKAWTAELNGSFAGFIAVGPIRPGYCRRTESEKVGQELFVKALITDRKCAGKGVGRRLLDTARDYAQQKHFDFMRLDCWRGPEGKKGLVGFYEGYGFQKLREFEIPAQEHHSNQPWPGQLLEIKLST